ncbi:MAG: NosD domain-containing protein [Verrucomicrobiota bacterium]
MLGLTTSTSPALTFTDAGPTLPHTADIQIGSESNPGNWTTTGDGRIIARGSSADNGAQVIGQGFVTGDDSFTIDKLLLRIDPAAAANEIPSNNESLRIDIFTPDMLVDETTYNVTNGLIFTASAPLPTTLSPGDYLECDLVGGPELQPHTHYLLTIQFDGPASATLPLETKTDSISSGGLCAAPVTDWPFANANTGSTDWTYPDLNRQQGLFFLASRFNHEDLVFFLTTDQPVTQPTPATRTTRSAIAIDGDSAFTAANGVRNPTAAGTASDPFIISGWEIDTDNAGAVGITVENTTAHYVIYNCRVSGDAFKGISLVNTDNGWIEDCEIFDTNREGIHITGASNQLVIRKNLIEQVTTGNGMGIHLAGGSQNVITHNHIDDCQWGGFFGTRPENVVSNNYLANSAHQLFFRYGADRNLAYGNHCDGSEPVDSQQDGILVSDGPEGNALFFNEVTFIGPPPGDPASGGKNGVWIWGAGDDTLLGINYIFDNGPGVGGSGALSLSSTSNRSVLTENAWIVYNHIEKGQPRVVNVQNGHTDNTFYGNAFIDGAKVLGPSANPFFSADLMIGNYWDDYTGIDGDNDGIGDTPAQNGRDLYPLMAPTPLDFSKPGPYALLIDQWQQTTGFLNVDFDRDGDVDSMDIRALMDGAEILSPVDVIIINGTGSGTYANNDTVALEADLPPAGMVFDKWTGDIGGIADTLGPVTSLTVDNSDTTITAEYKAAEAVSHLLTVLDGTTSGSYPEGTYQTITANPPPANFRFAGWGGDTYFVTDPDAATTTIFVPDHDVVIAATYEEVPPIDSASGGVWSTGPRWEDNLIPTNDKRYNALHDLETTAAIEDGTSNHTEVFGGAYLFINDQTLESNGFDSTNPVDRWNVTVDLEINGGTIFSALRQAPRWRGTWTMEGDLRLDAANVTSGTKIYADIHGDEDTIITIGAGHQDLWNGRFDFGEAFISGGNFRGLIDVGGGAEADGDAHGSARFVDDIPVATFDLRIFDSTDGSAYSDGDNADNHGKVHLANDIKVKSLSIGNDFSSYIDLPTGTYDFSALANIDGVNYQKFFEDEGGSLTVTPPGDTDCDDLSDTWELSYFGNLASTEGLPGQDSDKDGRSDREESVAGTNPLDPTDFFRVTASDIVANSFSITFQSMEERTYRVYWASDLSGSWTWHSSHPGTGEAITVPIDLNAINNPDLVFVQVTAEQ